jgi:hypothetical protein
VDEKSAQLLAGKSAQILAGKSVGVSKVGSLLQRGKRNGEMSVTLKGTAEDESLIITKPSSPA